MGIPVMGTLGLVIAARQRGAVPAVAPILSELRRTGLWLSDELVHQVLTSIGEHE